MAADTELKPPPDVLTETPEEKQAKGDVLEIGKQKATLAKGYEESVKQRAGELEAALNKPKPTAPETPNYPTPPSQKIRPFADNTPGEPWQVTAQKAMLQLGLLAQSVGGLVTGYPKGALAAMEGAYQGWAEGDKERGDRQFKEWGAITEQMKDKYEQDREHFRDLWENWQGDIESLKAKLGLEAAKMGASQGALEALQQNPETILKWLDDRKKLSLDSWQTWNQLALQHRAQQFHEDNMKRMEAANAETARHNRAIEDQKKDELIEKVKEKGIKGAKQAEASKAALVMAEQVKTRARRLAEDGYISKSNNVASIQAAHLKRILKPGDEVGAFAAHGSTMVALARATGDIGPRAQAAYQTVLNIVEHPTTLSALEAAVDDLTTAIKAGKDLETPEVDVKSAKSVDVGKPADVTPGALGGWSIKEIK